MPYFLIAWVLCSPAIFLYWKSGYGYSAPMDLEKWFHKHQNSVLALMVWWAIYFAFAGLFSALAVVTSPYSP